MNPIDVLRSLMERQIRYAELEYPSSWLAGVVIDEESFRKAREFCEEEVEDG